jgi:shikimate kinase
MLGKSNVFLIGPMGSGKSAVGKHVARLLEFPFYDSDHEVELRTGADIPLIFEREGEAGFRRREREALAELTHLRGVVLATGGGAVVDADTRRDLAAQGWVVYLEASVAQQAVRAGRTRHRPLLHGTSDPAARLAQLMQVREPLYRQIADFVISTNGRKVSVVAEAIAREFRGATAGTGSRADAGAAAADADADADAD